MQLCNIYIHIYISISLYIYIYTGFLKGPQVRPMPQMSITSPMALINIQALPKGRHSKTNRIKKKEEKKTLKEKKCMKPSKFKIHDSILIHIHLSPTNLTYGHLWRNIWSRTFAECSFRSLSRPGASVALRPFFCPKTVLPDHFDSWVRGPGKYRKGSPPMISKRDSLVYFFGA